VWSCSHEDHCDVDVWGRSYEMSVCVCVCVWGCSYEISVCACVCGVVAMKCRCVCVRGCSYEDDAPVQMRSRHIRPRARHKLNIADISIGSRVLVNYNYTEPETRGYWYDAVVTGKHVKRSVKQLTATVFIGYTCPTCLSLSQYCLYVLFLPVLCVPWELYNRSKVIIVGQTWL